MKTASGCEDKSCPFYPERNQRTEAVVYFNLVLRAGLSALDSTSPPASSSHSQPPHAGSENTWNCSITVTRSTQNSQPKSASITTLSITKTPQRWPIAGTSSMAHSRTSLSLQVPWAVALAPEARNEQAGEMDPHRHPKSWVRREGRITDLSSNIPADQELGNQGMHKGTRAEHL